MERLGGSKDTKKWVILFVVILMSTNMNYNGCIKSEATIESVQVEESKEVEKLGVAKQININEAVEKIEEIEDGKVEEKIEDIKDEERIEEEREVENHEKGLRDKGEETKEETKEETVEKDISVLLADKLEGKRVTTLGDSITYNDKKDTGTGLFVGYQSLLENKYNITPVKNKGITGAATAAGTRNGDGLSKAYQDEDFTDTDILIIASGTNDFRLDVELGTPEEIKQKEKNLETFYGAYSSLIENVLKSNPGIEIHLWTPLKRDNAGYSTESVNEAGYKLEDYRQAIKEIARNYNISCCDMYEESGIELENLDQLTTDGLHPNNAGYEVLFKGLEQYLAISIGG